MRTVKAHIGRHIGIKGFLTIKNCVQSSYLCRLNAIEIDRTITGACYAIETGKLAVIMLRPLKKCSRSLD